MKRLMLLVLEEPYRVFFPLGVLAGVWGVLMWPLFYGGHLALYPFETHARVMTAGFLGAFVTGFLGTAFPRLVGNQRWLGVEFPVLLALWLATVVTYSVGRIAAGDALFCGMLLVLAGGMAVRWLAGGRDIPPPGFVMVILGLAGAAWAAAYLAAGSYETPWVWRLARLWLYQGFPMLPVMGVGPYLLPRFFGRPSTHSFDESPTPPPGWWPRFSASCVAGAVVVGGLVAEAAGMAATGQAVRGAALVVWFALETPVFRRAATATTPATATRWAILSMAAGLVCAALWPHARVGSLHLFFVSGLGLLTLAAGTRVALGHAGRHDLLGGRMVWLRWVIGLAMLAAATRMTSDFVPAVRVSHHLYAAWTWVAASAVWLVVLARFLPRGEDDPEPARSCPRRRGPASGPPAA